MTAALHHHGRVSFRFQSIRNTLTLHGGSDPLSWEFGLDGVEIDGATDQLPAFVWSY